MYKVFPVEGGYQIFWCPSAPRHYADKVPYVDTHNLHRNGVYSKRQAAYRRCTELQTAWREEDAMYQQNAEKMGRAEQEVLDAGKEASK